MEIRNTLEAYCYDLRDKFSGDFEKYADPKLKEGCAEEITHTIEWIYGEG